MLGLWLVTKTIGHGHYPFWRKWEVIFSVWAVGSDLIGRCSDQRTSQDHDVQQVIAIPYFAVTPKHMAIGSSIDKKSQAILRAHFIICTGSICYMYGFQQHDSNIVSKNNIYPSSDRHGSIEKVGPCKMTFSVQAWVIFHHFPLNHGGGRASGIHLDTSQDNWLVWPEGNGAMNPSYMATAQI